MLLKRYSILSLIVIISETLLLFLFRTPLKKEARVPESYQELSYEKKNHTAGISIPDLLTHANKIINSKTTNHAIIPVSLIEKKLIASGLINIKQVDSSFAVNLKYATKDNFMHRNLYGDLTHAYLQKSIAEKLAKAQSILKKKYPYYSLIIYDAVRPFSIQQAMWDSLSPADRKYVANPKIGSLHNYGCAVDVSIIDDNGWIMDMGTPYDFFGVLGHTISERQMIQDGKLSWRQYENRKLLREIMKQAGFTAITTEWWHFNGSSLKSAREKYKIVE